MNKFAHVKAANNGVLPHDALNYLEVTTRVYGDRQGHIPPAEEVAVSVVEAIGSLVGFNQSVMVDTRPVSLTETDGGWIKSPHPVFGLTPRRMELASCIAQGMSNREIAGELYLAEATIKQKVSDLAQITGTSKRSGIPPVLWRVIVPHLLDHSRFTARHSDIKRTSVRP